MKKKYRIRPNSALDVIVKAICIYGFIAFIGLGTGIVDYLPL